MKKIVLVIMMLFMCSCQADNYTLDDYIQDTQGLFQIDNIQTDGRLEESLKCQDMAEILLEIAQEKQIDYLIALECFTKEMYDSNQTISQQKAKDINQIIYDDFSQKEFFETTFDIGEIQSVDETVELRNLAPGIYEQNGSFYEVMEDGSVETYDVETFELQSTFIPDLESSVILPEGSEMTPSDMNFFAEPNLQHLISRYFQFKLNDYSISGRIQNNGLQVKVQKKTASNIVVENELTIDNLKCTVDFSLENKRFYFRADYDLKDTLSVSKQKQIYQDKVTLDSFSQIKEKIQQMKNTLPIVEDELHLLTFQFDVPSTGKMVKVTLDLSLKLMINGEVRITFSTSHRQGSQSFQDNLCHLNQQQWEIDPYLEGNIECASVLSFELSLGTIRIGDVALQGGIGSEAIGRVHYVDLKKQLIETENAEIDLLTMENILASYDQLQDKYVDCCADVNVYYFARIKTNQSNCLLRKLGLYGSMTPLKNNLSLVHIENHHVVDACTKQEILFNPQHEIDAFDISNYQLHLSVGKTVTLTATKENCTFSSSNTDIVFVSEKGEITALKEGYTTIIVTTNDGVERHCLVFVK